MARRRMARGGGRSLPSARVEWLSIEENPLIGTFTSATRTFAIEMYDFGAATKIADNYGAGDWSIERIFFSAGAHKAQAALSDTIACITFGIGILNTATSITDSTAAAALDAGDFPAVSWMIYVTCYVALNSLEIVKCEGGFKARRRISPESKIIFTASTDVLLVAGQQIDFLAKTRILLRQRGSRL